MFSRFFPVYVNIVRFSLAITSSEYIVAISMGVFYIDGPFLAKIEASAQFM